MHTYTEPVYRKFHSPQNIANPYTQMKLRKKNRKVSIEITNVGIGFG